MTPAATGLVAAAALLVVALRLTPAGWAAAPRRPGGVGGPRRRRLRFDRRRGPRSADDATVATWCEQAARSLAAGHRCRGR